MARVPLLEKDQVSDKVALRAYESMEQKRGKVTNIYKALAYKPEIIRTIGPFVASVQASYEVDARLKEKIMIKVSKVNNCPYCIHAHMGISSKMGIPREEFDELDDLDTAIHLTDAERVALQYAEHITRTPEGVPDELFDELKKHYTDSQIVEITCLAALYNFINRFNAALDLDIEDY